MSELNATWMKLSSSPILERSSQTVSVVGNKVYIFGGELYSREPRDNAVYIIDVETGRPIQWISIPQNFYAALSTSQMVR